MAPALLQRQHVGMRLKSCIGTPGVAFAAAGSLSGVIVSLPLSELRLGVTSASVASMQPKARQREDRHGKVLRG